VSRWIPDLTRPPEGQSRAQRVVGVVLLLAVFVLAAVRW
jgi:hypothetical protein